MKVFLIAALLSVSGLIPGSAWAFQDYHTKALVIGSFEGNTLHFQCSGNLIENEQWVLTAGHCMKNFSPENPTIFRSPNRQTAYRAKAVFAAYSPPEMGYFTSLKTFYSQYFNSLDIALVRVERISGPAASGAIPRPISVNEMDSMREKIGEYTLISTKLRSDEDLVIADRIQERRLVVSEQISKLIHEGDSGSSILSEDGKVVAVITEMATIASSKLAAIYGRSRVHATALLLPYGLCSLAHQIFGRPDIEVDADILRDLHWLKTYSADCGGITPTQNEALVLFMRAK